MVQFKEMYQCSDGDFVVADFIVTKKYPKWTEVHRIVEGAESAPFKQYFATWRDQGMSHSRLIRAANDNGKLENTLSNGNNSILSHFTFQIQILTKMKSSIHLFCINYKRAVVVRLASCPIMVKVMLKFGASKTLNWLQLIRKCLECSLVVIRMSSSTIMPTNVGDKVS